MADIIGDIAFLLFPSMPPFEEVSDLDHEEADRDRYAYEQQAEAVEQARERYVRDLNEEADATGRDPVLLALERVHQEMAEQLRQRALLLAYARVVAPGRTLPLRTLGSSAGLSASTVRTAYTPDDVQAVMDILGRRVPADAELAAMNAIDEAPERDRLDVYLQVTRRLDDAALERVRAWIVRRFHGTPYKATDLAVATATASTAGYLGLPVKPLKPREVVLLRGQFVAFADDRDEVPAIIGYFTGQAAG